LTKTIARLRLLKSAIALYDKKCDRPYDKKCDRPSDAHALD